MPAASAEVLPGKVGTGRLMGEDIEGQADQPVSVADDAEDANRQASVGDGLFAGLAGELRTTWALFSVDNVSVTIIPGAIFTVSVWFATTVPSSPLYLVLGRAMIYFFLYGYTFCLSNQLAGVEEDRRNKPHRPLVRGLVTVAGARRRLAISMVAYVLAGLWLRVLEWTLLWMAVTILHNQFRLSRFWVTKNTAMFLGIIAMLTSGAQQAGGTSATIWRWIIVIAATNAVLVPLQDLRDIEGDLAVGRRTFPQVFGDRATRVLLCSGFCGYPLLLQALLIAPARTSPVTVAFDSIWVFLSLLVAVRVAICRTKRADHLTYLLYCWLYCAILAAPGFVLHVNPVT
jgi:4-hydroxybenzoate polyprenyltransferase